jgi:cell division septation protein DedD
MKTLVSNILGVSCIILGILIIGCSSGEYDLDEYQVTYNEKTIKADTIRTIVADTVTNDRNNIIEEKKDKYSYVVQIGAFVMKTNLDRFFEQAKQLVGPEVYYEFTNSLYKIRIGYFTNRADAMLLLEKVLNLGYSDAFIVTKKMN